MKEIIGKLESLWKHAKENPSVYLDSYDGRNFFRNGIDEVDDISSELCWKLINESGDINQFGKALLMSCGFSVYPGEQDGIGWLSACLEKDNMTLIFG